MPYCRWTAPWHETSTDYLQIYSSGWTEALLSIPETRRWGVLCIPLPSWAGRHGSAPRRRCICPHLHQLHSPVPPKKIITKYWRKHKPKHCKRNLLFLSKLCFFSEISKTWTSRNWGPATSPSASWRALAPTPNQPVTYILWPVTFRIKLDL